MVLVNPMYVPAYTGIFLCLLACLLHTSYVPIPCLRMCVVLIADSVCNAHSHDDAGIASLVMVRWCFEMGKGAAEKNLSQETVSLWIMRDCPANSCSIPPPHLHTHALQGANDDELLAELLDEGQQQEGVGDDQMIDDTAGDSPQGDPLGRCGNLSVYDLGGRGEGRCDDSAGDATEGDPLGSYNKLLNRRGRSCMRVRVDVWMCVCYVCARVCVDVCVCACVRALCGIV